MDHGRPKQAICIQVLPVRYISDDVHRIIGSLTNTTTRRHRHPQSTTIAIMVKNSLGQIMQTFKAAVSRQAVRDGLMPRGTPIWQRGYFEHIIREDGEHDRIAR
jgi:REP element-mobilizing transposase RayT